MNSVIDDIERAVRDLKLSKDSFARLPTDEAQVILKDIAFLYVGGGTRVWWNSLRCISSRKPETREVNLGRISSELPSTDDSVWLVPDSDDGSLNAVYRAIPEALDKVLGETNQFEYYVIAMDYRWLLAVTDHSEIIRCQC